MPGPILLSRRGLTRGYRLHFDRATATIARQLIWDYGLTTRDAMHLATAVRWKLTLLETLDGDDLIPLSGQVGDPPIEIRLPRWDEPPPVEDDQSAAALQMAMELENGEQSQQD